MWYYVVLYVQAASYQRHGSRLTICTLDMHQTFFFLDSISAHRQMHFVSELCTACCQALRQPNSGPGLPCSWRGRVCCVAFKSA